MNQNNNNLRFMGSYSADIHQEVIKQLPHVITGVDLFHLHLRVHVAVIQEVHIRHLHLRERNSRLIHLFILTAATSFTG